MPIEYSTALESVGQDKFEKIDYDAMGAAFSAHNKLGRLFDESHYACEMAEQLRKNGNQVEHEVRISLTCDDFRKDYFIDLLVDSCVPYELKTVDKLNSKHHAQALNYLFLSGLHHGKLVNFRRPSVESTFVSTTIEPSQRFEYTIDDSQWSELPECSIRPKLEKLLNEWGTHLSLAAYSEGLSHFCCSPALSNQPVRLKSDSGYQSEISLNRIDETSFLYLTTSNQHSGDHRKHLQKLLYMTGQKSAQWIHLDRNRVRLTSVTQAST